MASPTYPATDFTEGTELFLYDVNQIHEVINSDAETAITVDDGTIPSLRKSIVDNFYFLDPVDWEEGTDITVFNQLVLFTNGILYYAPLATPTNPITMGTTPEGDSNFSMSVYSATDTSVEAFATAAATSAAEAEGFRDESEGFRDEVIAVNTVATDAADAASASATTASNSETVVLASEANVVALEASTETFASDAAASATVASESAEEAQLVADAIQDMYDNFDSSVVTQVLAESSPANIDWDVEIDFNDGLDIKKGYGNRDTYGNKAVDFSRASGAGSIGKSGLYEELTEDSPAIVNSGVSIYGAETNLILSSEDFSTTDWTTPDVTLSDGIDLFGIQSTLTVAVSNTKSVFQSLAVDSEAGEYTASFLAKKSSSDRLYCGVYDTTSTTWIIDANVNYIDLSSGVEKEIELNFTKPEDTTTIRLYVFRAIESEGALDAYVTAAQVTNSISKKPYIATTSATSTRSSDVVSVPIINNIPSVGNPFTIMSDVTIPITGEDARVLSEDTNFYLGRLSTGEFSATVLDGDGSSTTITNTNTFPETTTRVGLVFSGNELETYINGVAGGVPVACDGLTLDLTSDFYIGSSLGSSLFANGSIANLRIKFGELSAGQMKALGGAL